MRWLIAFVPGLAAAAEVFSDAEWAAAQRASTPVAGTEAGWGTILVLLGGLVAIIAVAVGLGWLARRLNARRLLGGKGRHLQVLETVALAPKRSLALVRVGDQVLVVGVADQAITSLAQLPASQLGEPAPPPPSAFAQTLAQVQVKQP
jgi:flagellar biosynthetic protein FliO